jgi:DNA-binding XRE family transcriptional regulator
MQLQPNTHFKELRKKRLNLSQEELAAEINVSQGTITDIERGRIGVSKRVAKRLQEKFGLSLVEIFGNSNRLNNSYDNSQGENTEKNSHNKNSGLKNLGLQEPMESIKAMEDKVLNEVLNEFLKDCNFFSIGTLQVSIYQELKAGSSEQQIKAAMKRRMDRLDYLRETCADLNIKLKASIEDLKASDSKDKIEYI